MTLQSALMRAIYIRTLRRHIGPLLGYRVRDVANDLRPSVPPANGRTDGEATPLASSSDFLVTL